MTLNLGKLLRINFLGTEKQIESELETISEFMKQFYKETIEKITARCIVVGRFESGDTTVFVPVGNSLDALGDELSVYATFWESEQHFDYIEYTLSEPDYADGFRRYVNEIIPGLGSGSLESPMVIDSSEAENMHRTLTLLDVLYPFAVAAAAVLGGLFPGLIVMRSDIPRRF